MTVASDQEILVRYLVFFNKFAEAELNKMVSHHRSRRFAGAVGQTYPYITTSCEHDDDIRSEPYPSQQSVQDSTHSNCTRLMRFKKSFSDGDACCSMAHGLIAGTEILVGFPPVDRLCEAEGFETYHVNEPGSH